jgi:opacity protein-like surface antigen
MRRSSVLIASVLLALAAQAASAQSATQASDSWSKPASASTVKYGDSNRASDQQQNGHFKFKDNRPHVTDTARPDPNRPKAINDNSVFGDNERPAANCAADPRNSKCH